MSESPSEVSETRKGATFWDFGIEFLRTAWKAIDGGHLFSFVLVIGAVIVAIIFVRMPTDEIAPSLRVFIELFASRLMLVIGSGALHVVVVYMWRKDVSYYRDECKRLGDEKSYWVHAPVMKKHHSSDYGWPGKATEDAESSDE